MSNFLVQTNVNDIDLTLVAQVAGKRKGRSCRKSWLRYIKEWTGIEFAARLVQAQRNEYVELTAKLHLLESHIKKTLDIQTNKKKVVSMLLLFPHFSKLAVSRSCIRFNVIRRND